MTHDTEVEEVKRIYQLTVDGQEWISLEDHNHQLQKAIDENNRKWEEDPMTIEHHENITRDAVQKAREEERERIKKIVMILGTKNMANGAGFYKMLYPNEIIDAINHSELDQDKK